MSNLQLGTSSPTHRSIAQGSVLKVSVPGSNGGYLIAAVYSKTGGLVAVREDGIPGNWNNGQPDPQDGLVEVPLYHKFVSNGPVINFPKGSYYLKVEAADSPTAAVPTFYNFDFDIV